jgi:hypothetical protein
MYRAVATLFAAITLLVAAPAHAEDSAHLTSNILGLRVIGGAAVAHGHSAGVLGVGFSGEHAFFHHLMELELVGSYLTHGEESGFDGEIVVNFPWSPNERFDFYAGGGGMVEYNGARVMPGFLIDVGSRAWASEHWGVGVEVDLVHLFADEQTNAVEGIVAALYRF